MSLIITEGYLRGSPSAVILQGYATAAALTLREAVAAWVRSQTSVTSIVGSSIYFAQPSQQANYPCLIIKVPTRKYGHNLGGADGTSIATVSLIALAYYESQCVAVVEAVRNFADGFRGAQSGVTILSCLLDDEADDDTAPPDGSDKWIYQVSLDYVVKHRVPAPTSVTQTGP
jgi:hypothetical protein